MGQGPVDSHHRYLRDSLFSDPKTALAAVWFFSSVDPNEFLPSTLEFKEWRLPHLELEFDHTGAFTELPGKNWHYGAAETKSSHSSIANIWYN